MHLMHSSFVNSKKTATTLQDENVIHKTKMQQDVAVRAITAHKIDHQEELKEKVSSAATE